MEQLLSDKQYLDEMLVLVLVLAAATASYFVARRILLRSVHAFLARTKNKWDDVLIDHGVTRVLAYFVPVVVIYLGLTLFQLSAPVTQKALNLTMVVLTLMLLSRLLTCLLDVYDSSPWAREHPLKGYVQLVKIFLILVGLILIVSMLMDKSPWVLLSGIGAVMAILLLIFKDTILSLVASVQIAGNDLLRRGDWIEMPQFGADGEVIDIALHIVKVQNWDKTIVSIPTHKFLDNSFKNWRGMQQTGGRRIKRSLLIDQSSIHFLEPERIERLKQVDLLREYLEGKEKELREFNRNRISRDQPASVINARRLTNIGTLRAYILAYLRTHPLIRQDLTLLVRQLQPGADSGLPLEIYAFAADTRWDAYEAIQADIFDHILAVIPEFGLRAYQRDALSDPRTGEC
ncbi:MAG: mechanosensitive ion channel family protein [Desulfovibrionales bacterium]